MVMSKLSIVIPCYNEKNNIVRIVEKVRSVPEYEKEIIVVDDCSTDGTREILKNQVEPLVAKVLYQDVNQGKGAALRAGFSVATGDVVIVQDADDEYDPMEYKLVVQPVFDGEYPVVYGSRFLEGKRDGYFANRVANAFLTFLSNLFTGQKLTDMETCYKAFRRDIIQSIEIVENRFGFEPEITAKLSGRGIKIHEVPISYHPRTTQEGKKIGISDGIRALYCIAKYKK